VKLTPDAEKTAIAFNALLTNACPGNDINLNTTEQPHVTMYLTSFTNTQPVEDAIKEIVPTLLEGSPACNDSAGPMVLEGFTVNGCYAMWKVQPNPCLQHISDAVVNATYGYATPDQPIPDWVEALPEPLRSEKEDMIHRYGSPNVFGQFDPHVTLGFDCDGAPKCFDDALQAGASPTLRIESDVLTLALGVVGAHGTVVRGEDMAEFQLR